ncbi:MOP flippase family protein [Pseudoalteromonas tunicata]|uniref:MOP flippase family protein n=1 Tax=Pseudoalteromonas tunicata TaxID=314281 RepID=UPI00273EB2D9|nr:MOP flippase family protein [Pseudoalteromonas tunicata]MDP4982462.1 MOP flippase family protein [Pseudoalteromonas tunicata]
MNVVKAAIHSVSWTALATLCKGGLQLVQLIILARFLTPIELGLLAMLNLLIGLAQILGEAGLSNAIIFKQDISKPELNQLYLVNVGLGFFVTVIIGLLALPLESFFAMAGLASLLVLLSPLFFIRSLSQQQTALLQQKMCFNQLAKLELVAAIVGFIVLLILLKFEFRLYAVVLAQLVSAVLFSFALLILYQSLRPKIVAPNFRAIKASLKYGGYQSGEGVLNYLGAQLDQLLIGKLLGAETLGIYAYLKALVFRPALQIINPIVNSVAFPLMVKYQHSHSLQQVYLVLLKLLSFINIPLYLVMACYPQFVLGLVFGDNWLEHAELFKWLAIYMLVIALMNPIGVLLRASGEVKRGFYWNFFVSLVRPVVIVIAIGFGVVVLVQVLVLLQLAFFILHYWVLIKPIIAVSFGRFIFSSFTTLCVFLTSLAGVILFDSYVYKLSDGIAVIMVLSIYLLLIFSQIFAMFKLIKRE